MYKEDNSYHKHIVCEELTVFLNSLTEEDWNEDFKSIVKTELDEGSYLSDLDFDIETIEYKFKEGIIRILSEDNQELLNKYMAVVKSI